MDYDGVRPDVVVLGKALSGGTIPVRAIYACAFGIKLAIVCNEWSYMYDNFARSLIFICRCRVYWQMMTSCLLSNLDRYVCTCAARQWVY